MKHMIQRNARIAEELILLAYKHRAQDIKLDIKNKENETLISIEATNINLDNENLNTIKELLNTPRCKEMEEYYWNLTGESDTDCELSLIGVMIDEIELNFENKKLKINVKRKK